MRKMQSHNDLSVDIDKKSDWRSQKDPALTEILHHLFNTQEIRQLLITALPVFMKTWAGHNRWKQTVYRAAGRVVNKQLSHSDDASKKNKIRQLFEDEAFVKNMIDLVPGFIDLLSGTLAAGGETLAKLSISEKKTLFKNLIEKAGQGRTGSLVTIYAKIINDIHTDDPEFFTRMLAPCFEQLVTSTDFGEIKESFDNSRKDVTALFAMLNDLLWHYPPKGMLFYSLLPTTVNMTLEAVRLSIEKINEQPPDLIADVLLSFFRELDATSLAEMTNQLTEIVRKLHTGSALIGNPGAPLLPMVLATKMGETVEKIDPVKIWKARIALAEIRASFDRALSETINDHPELKQLSNTRGPEISNIHIRTLNHKLDWWDMVDDETAAESVSDHLAAYDIEEAVGMINNLLCIFNRVVDQKPDLVPHLCRRMANDIDIDGLADVGRRVFESASTELHPIARSIVPGLVEWVCNVIQPADDEYEDEASSARASLASLFKAEEA